MMKPAAQDHSQIWAQGGKLLKQGRGRRRRERRLGSAFARAAFLIYCSHSLTFNTGMQLSAEQLRRYARHLSLPEVGVEGQKKIRAARVLCIGAGGLGSPIALYLAAAGVGKIGIVDFDAVELSNLQRQVLHGTEDVGRPKTESARDTIHRINPEVEVELHNARLTSQNALEIIRPYSIVVDGTDNFPTRYLTNDACVLLRKPNVYGSVFRFEGQASVFAPHLGAPCYRCLYPEPPPPGLVPNCAEGGVLGVLPGLIGMIQATEILKLAAGIGTSLLNRLLLFDALEMKFREIKLRRDPKCPLCGEQPTVKALIDYEDFCGVRPKDTNQVMHPDEVTVQEMKQALENASLGIIVIDVREPEEYAIAQVAGVSLLPLSQLAHRYTELDPTATYYIHCKAGGRSMQALQFLRQQGFSKLKSVKGGITAWSNEIDPAVPKY
jgi:adenylyltransferase/sulfurtransferase